MLRAMAVAWRWDQHAACRGLPSSLWLDPPSRMHQRLALAVCEVCPVRAECLAEALGKVWTKGVWGGTTEADRFTAARRSALREELRGTHLRCAGNLVLLCSRHHHLLHTPGWRAKLLPDSILETTDPTGHVRTSHLPGASRAPPLPSENDAPEEAWPLPAMMPW